MENGARNFWLTVIIGPLLVLLIWWGFTEWRDSVKAEPVLTYQSMKPGKGFVDIKLVSGSTETFPIHGVLYRIVKIVRKPPPPPPPAPKPQPPRQRKRWFGNQSKPGKEMCGASISPDDVVVRPGPPVLNQWIQGEEEFLELDPKKGEVIRFQIKDSFRAGARYRVRVAVMYGDREKPKSECVPEFEIDVVKE